MSSELLPRRASFRPGGPIEIEARGAPGGRLVVRHLGDMVHEAMHDGGDIVLPPLPEGGYSVHLGELATAVEVTADPRLRLRYGFAASYAPDKDVTGLADMVRRLHLTGVQFYDWAYRHADLMGGGEAYRDALDQPIALSTVRRLVEAVQQAGSRALGYAAVYAVGPGEWPRWNHQALLRGDGESYGLGDFLFILDPAAPDWLAHFTADLEAATASLGFDGYHLDQYGYPKWAARADGQIVDVAASFVTLINNVRKALPQTHLVFNNVNDFPTRQTARAPQDAVYIEPWAPQLTLQSLADTVARARTSGAGKPVVMAAYQHVYDSAPAESADTATALTMATLFSHGATQLLAGEADRLLCDPYYVRNHVMAPSTAALLKRWYDFMVAHDELLFPSEVTDVTDAFAGAYNMDLDIDFGGIAISERAEPGKIWRRITQVGHRIVIHVINLTGQTDCLWDAPRQPIAAVSNGRLTLDRLATVTKRVQVASPDNQDVLVEIPPAGGLSGYPLPDLQTWQMIVVELHRA